MGISDLFQGKGSNNHLIKELLYSKYTNENAVETGM
jgi:hypothetical protein